MEIDRETVVEAAVSFVAVLVFIGAVALVSLQFGSSGALSDTGGMAMVGAIVLFVLVMTGVGFWFASKE
jgi:hypothetical protein